MTITKERKAELVALYKRLLANTSGIVVTENRGMSYGQVNDLRTRLREQHGKFLIVKNTLFMIALRDMGWPVPEDVMVGPVGIALGNGNFPDVAKTVLGFAEANADFCGVKAGIMAGQILSAAQVDAVSKLPPLDEMRAQLAGLIVQPAAGLVSVINAGVASVAQVLHAYVQKNNPEGEAAA